MATTILLDAGGVLLDEAEHEAAWARVLTEVLDLAPDEYERDVEEAVRIYVPRIYRYVLMKHAGPDPEQVEQLWEEALRRYAMIRPPLTLMPDIDIELHALTVDFKLGHAGQYGAELNETLDAAGLLDLFTWRHTQDDFDLTKPDPRYLLQIAGAFGVAPADCIMVGDRIDKDVVPARQCGMKTILVRTGLHRDQQPRLPEEIPDADLPSVKGLAEAALGLA